MSELKPCSFCGSEAKLYTIFDSVVPWDLHQVECKKCHSKTTECETRGLAIKSWNTRIETMDGLICNVEKWARDKGLNKAQPRDQYLKVAEECGEIAAGLARGNKDAVKDAIGDTMVTLIILAQQMGLTLEECLQVAWDEIKDRTGEMRDGVFVKSEDL
ncbi:Lar family restriction alleviation protein [Eubacterium barkeri]|uniref:Restriction alleviation protein, Lar family n=1 Tax=Eubacterium barkeri TaxID=1528 RepID=A0A1H3IRT8_EUBBA|nr:Lar family restriction alleviation protein [Eubacterium barkeri]SDY29939.1 restriction alleviation protein, Lar family [Eubacterium barkeri]